MRLINAQGKRRHVKHYLTSLRAMSVEMREKEERMRALRQMAEGLRSAMGESVAGGSKRDLADVAAELEALEDEYAGDLARYATEIAEGYRICPPSDIPRYACWLHWAEGMTWGQVGKRLNYGSDHVRKDVCDMGVESIYDIMPHRWREESSEAI